MRVALFGGTFDPPHRGHIAVAKAAADAFDLDKVLFAPTGLQPLKLDAARTPFAIRLQMTAAACEEDPRFSVTDIDAPHADHSPNYTVDTLTTLTAEHPQDILFNLVGADSFLSLRRWRDPDRLPALAEWIVVTRPGYEFDDETGSPQLHFTPAQRKRVHLLTGVAANISATEVRHRLSTGDNCSDVLNEATAAYIKRESLYVSDRHK